MSTDKASQPLNMTMRPPTQHHHLLSAIVDGVKLVVKIGHKAFFARTDDAEPLTLCRPATPGQPESLNVKTELSAQLPGQSV